MTSTPGAHDLLQEEEATQRIDSDDDVFTMRGEEQDVLFGSKTAETVVSLSSSPPVPPLMLSDDEDPWLWDCETLFEGVKITLDFRHAVVVRHFYQRQLLTPEGTKGQQVMFTAPGTDECFYLCIANMRSETFLAWQEVLRSEPVDKRALAQVEAPFIDSFACTVAARLVSA